MQYTLPSLALLLLLSVLSCTANDSSHHQPPPPRPNIVIILADDLGFGDLAYNGHPTVQTPHLDRLSREGVRLNQMYTPNPLCTPARAALLTGRLGVRMGLAGQFETNPTNATSGVLPCHAEFGIPSNETTLAEYLQANGYDTHYIGKWHLGQTTPYLPAAHGFNDFYGIPYSVDMGYFQSASECIGAEKLGCPPIPLMQDSVILEQPVARATLSEQLVTRAEQIIRKAAKKDSESSTPKPFFLQFSSPQVHIDCAYNPFHSNVSTTTPAYLASVEELDGLVGRIMKVLDNQGLSDNTLVIFLSDNGPLTLPQAPAMALVPVTEERGSVGPFTGTYSSRFPDVTNVAHGNTDVGKCSTWEAGLRIPGIIRYPSYFAKNTAYYGTMTLLDVFPSILGLLQIPISTTNFPLDGQNMFPSIQSGETDDTRTLFFYRGAGLYAARQGNYKYHFAVQGGCSSPDGHGLLQATPLTFNLLSDVGESYPVAPATTGATYTSVQTAVAAHLAGLNAPPSLLTAVNPNLAPCCNVTSNCWCP